MKRWRNIASLCVQKFARRLIWFIIGISVARITIRQSAMPITLDLRENGRVLYSVFTFPYTLSDAITAQRKEVELRDKAGGTVHALVNLSASGKPPSGALKVARTSPALV